jgi:sigma-B regulation protein RsbU (phosphoserine phosphatase)
MIWRGGAENVAIAYLQDKPSPSLMRYRDAHSRPCAGSLTDVFLSSGERANILIANVYGRDAQVPGHARYLRNLARAWAEEHDPNDLLTRVNVAFHRYLADEGQRGFAAVFFATLQQRQLTYASAGHGFALLITPFGRQRYLPLTGPIVGISGAERYVQRTFTVAPGDWLILATDGVTEIRNENGAAFGPDRVLRHALSAIGSGFDDPAEWILEAARAHGLGHFAEDASVLCVRFS